MMKTFSSLARTLGEGWVEMSLRTLIPVQDQSEVAQRAETTVTECSMTSCASARFSDTFLHRAWTAESTHSDFVGFPQRGTPDEKIKDPSVENPELKGSPFYAWAHPYITIRATPTARDFFLANFYPSGLFTCIFQKPLPRFFSVGCG